MSIEVKTETGVEKVLGVELMQADTGQTFTFSNNCTFQYQPTVTIPDNVTSITGAANALMGHTEITKLIIAPRETTFTISANAFQNCSNVENIEIPNGVTLTMSGNNIFAGCAKLTDEACEIICNHATISAVCSNTFRACNVLQNIIIPYTAGTYMFVQCAGLESVELTDETVTSIAQFAFNQCTSLSSVTMPSTVTEIQVGAFQSCSMLSTFDFHSGLATIGANAFSWTKLSEVDLPSSITALGTATFSNCTSLRKVILHSVPAVTNGTWAATSNPFSNCTAVEEFNIPEGWNVDLYLAFSTALTHDTLVGVITNLYDFSGDTAHTLTIGATNLAKLSEEEIAVATGKNWTVN